MNDYKLNYDKLKRLPILKLRIVIIIIILTILILIFFACHLSIERKVICLGVVKDNLLNIEITENLSDKVKNSNKLIFNKKKMNYRIANYGEFQINNGSFIECIALTVDHYVYDNEIGKVEIIYGKEKIIKYILELFK